MNRIDRLTAILIQLQSKRVVKADEIADRFEISLRTVYRDVKALMEAGVPIGSEAGKGYFIVEGYNLPPVMLTREEASAVLMAGKLVEKMTDHSIRKAFESALLKIKSVLKDAEKDHLENLESYIEVGWQPGPDKDFPNSYLSEIQQAVVNKEIIEIEYHANYSDHYTKRTLEPIGLFYYGSAWHLIAWCHLRSDYRDFRADRISELIRTGKKFDNRNLLSLQEYLKTVTQANQDLEKVVVLFDRKAARYAGSQKHSYGFVSEEDLGEKIKMTFLTGYMRSIARWLLLFGNTVKIESPEYLKDMMLDFLEELNSHYNNIAVAGTGHPHL